MAEAVHVSATIECAKQGDGADMIYYPTNKMQNLIFRRAMLFKYQAAASKTLWIGIKKEANGKWLKSNGEELTPLEMDWAPGEPSGTDTCAVADKVNIGFKAVTLNSNSNPRPWTLNGGPPDAPSPMPTSVPCTFQNVPVATPSCRK